VTEREARHPPLVETSGLEDAPVGWPAAGELARALGAGGLILAIWAALGVLLATLLRSTAGLRRLSARFSPRFQRVSQGLCAREC
jgi:hypothetical protein